MWNYGCEEGKKNFRLRGNLRGNLYSRKVYKEACYQEH